MFAAFGCVRPLRWVHASVRAGPLRRTKALNTMETVTKGTCSRHAYRAPKELKEGTKACREPFLTSPRASSVRMCSIQCCSVDGALEGLSLAARFWTRKLRN